MGSAVSHRSPAVSEVAARTRARTCGKPFCPVKTGSMSAVTPHARQSATNTRLQVAVPVGPVEAHSRGVEQLNAMPRALGVVPRRIPFVADAPLDEAQDGGGALGEGQAQELARPADEDRILGIVPSRLAHVFRLRLAVGEVDPPGVRSPAVGRARRQARPVRRLAVNQAHAVVAEAVLQIRARDEAIPVLVDGLYSVHGVAARFQVTDHIVHYWIQKGWLKGIEGGGPGTAWWFKLDSATVRRLHAAKARGYGPKRTTHSETRAQKEKHHA